MESARKTVPEVSAVDNKMLKMKKKQKTTWDNAYNVGASFMSQVDHVNDGIAPRLMA